MTNVSQAILVFHIVNHAYAMNMEAKISNVTRMENVAASIQSLEINVIIVLLQLLIFQLVMNVNVMHMEPWITIAMLKLVNVFAILIMLVVIVLIVILECLKLKIRFQLARIVNAIFMDPRILVLAMNMGSVHVNQIGWVLNVVFVKMSITWQTMIA